MKLPEQLIESCIAKEECGYILRGVLFDAEKNVLVATDGHIIAVVPGEGEKGDQTGVVSAIAWKLGRAAAKRIPQKLREGAGKISASVQILKHRLIVRGLSETTVLPKLTGQFPNWGGLFKDVKPTCSISLDVALLHKLSLALCGPGMPQMVTLFVQSQDKPVGVMAEHGKGVGLLMPVRTTNPSFEKRCEEMGLNKPTKET